jgi:hypothetical protein
MTATAIKHTEAAEYDYIFKGLNTRELSAKYGNTHTTWENRAKKGLWRESRQRFLELLEEWMSSPEQEQIAIQKTRKKLLERAMLEDSDGYSSADLTLLDKLEARHEKLFGQSYQISITGDILLLFLTFLRDEFNNGDTELAEKIRKAIIEYMQTIYDGNK